MKKKHKHNLFTITICLWCLLSWSSCNKYKYHFGVSQCFHNDWNKQLSLDLQREANSHPEIELEIALSTEGAQKQIADIEDFIRKKVDIIIISPEEIIALSPVINKAVSSGIPVILIDHENEHSNYTSSICVDNVEIGRRTASYSIPRLGGHGKVLSIMGHQGSSAAADRMQGLRKGFKDFPEIQIVDSCYTDWSYEGSYSLIDSLLELHPDIDMIASQSDPMALAAYDVCQKRNLQKLPIISGVDGVPGEGNGIMNVKEGKISFTCINPTGGLESIHLALDILEGRPYERNIKLNTKLIDKDNVDLYLQQEERVLLLTKRIEEVNGILGHYFQRTNLLQMVMGAIFLVVLLISVFAIYIHRSRQQRRILLRRINDANQTKLSFFANVSHSFRTPLTLIADPVRTMLKESNLSERQIEMLQLMERQSEKLLTLTDQVLKVLQNDLLKDGAALDAVAQKSADSVQSAADLRKKSFGSQFEISAEETRKTILIIDDNSEIRQYLSLILQGRNYLVLTAPNGEEGLIVAQQNIPDLIICDVMMPVMDGLECCRRLKADQNTSHIPVIMLTAYALDDQRIQGYQSGADAYITKPFNTDVLCARIGNLIDSRKRMDTTKEHTEEVKRVELGTVDREFVEHFHNFVVENMSDIDLDIQQLSDEFNMSRVQLYRKCKSLTTHSPIEIIRDIRLKEAYKLLSETDKAVSEIAYEVGFSSPSYFARCYKEQYNESPTDVQRRNKRNPAGS